MQGQRSVNNKWLTYSYSVLDSFRVRTIHQPTPASMCCMQLTLLLEADSCPTTKMGKFIFKKRKKNTAHARTGPRKPVYAVCLGKLYPPKYDGNHQKTYPKQWISHSETTVECYLKIERRQKVPACSLSTNSDLMLRQHITWKKTNRVELAGAEVTSPPLYSPLFETHTYRSLAIAIIKYTVKQED